MVTFIERFCDFKLFSIFKMLQKYPPATEEAGTGKLFCEAGVAESTVL
jgi:hypothetical protein